MAGTTKATTKSATTTTITTKTTTKSATSIKSKLTSKAFRQFQQNYLKRNSMDPHIQIFRAVRDKLQVSNVLYPGCHRHVSASVAFPSVLYIDSDSKVAAVFDDQAVDRWIHQHKTYSDPVAKEFYCGNYESPLPAKLLQQHHQHPFDLLISLSAGIVSTPCTKYIADRGYLLVSDAHSDARTAFLNPEWNLIYAWDDNAQRFATDSLHEYFQVLARSSSKSSSKSSSSSSPCPITQDMVDESIRIGTQSKRSFRLKKEARFYLFQKRQGRQRQQESKMATTTTTTATAVTPATKKRRTDTL